MKVYKLARHFASAQKIRLCKIELDIDNKYSHPMLPITPLITAQELCDPKYNQKVINILPIGNNVICINVF